MASTCPPSADGSEIARWFTELTGDTLRVLLLVTTLLVWAWLALVIHYAKVHANTAWVVVALILAAVLASYRLQESRLNLAVGVYLSALAIAVTFSSLAFRGTPVVYLYLLVVLIAAMLTDQRTSWGFSVASVGLALIVSLTTHTAQLADSLFPIALILVTALTSWLSSRRLRTALAWAHTMTKEAQKSTREARERRAEVRSILKSLDEAYARLERANEALLFAREAAEKAYQFKAEFVANVSHELRTPLNLIVGFSEMMATAPESYGRVPLPASYAGDVMAIYRSAHHLSDLINDVLDLSRIEAGRLPLKRELADLREVVQEAAEIVRGLAEAKGLRLELEFPESLPLLRLDRTRVRQVLLNLLTNATRYTDSGTIRARIQLEGQDVVVTIQDSGRGIPAHALAKAFEAFNQLDEGRAREGSGLGLALSKKFIELHGGTMSIESELGRGTTVRFALPFPKERRDAEASLLRTGQTAHNQERLVLVLHDDPRVCALLDRHVEGCRFVLADTLEGVPGAVSGLLPSAVVMDSAWARHRAVSAEDLQLPANTPLLTCPLPSLRRLGLLLGAADFLVKPVTREDLAQALGRLPKQPRTALIVDDDVHIVRLLERLLQSQSQGLTVLEAFSGQEGLEAALSERPDLILLDLSMPGVSGYELLEHLKGDPSLAEIQVIIVSAHAMDQETAPLQGEVRLTRQAGFSLTEMLQMLQAVLPAVTQPGATSRANPAALPAEQPG